MSAKINKLFKQVSSLPQIPEVVQLLIEQFNNPDVNIKDIAKNVEKEQVIALKVLRLVNSAQFGLAKKIASIDEAVVMLGMSQLRALVIASGIVNSVPKLDSLDIRQFWLNSFSTANYAKWFASKTGYDADIAFTAGLISGLGTILIHLAQPKEAKEIETLIEAGHERIFIEKMRLGFHSYEVSAELCKLWKFSDELIIPIAQSGEPLKFTPPSKIASIIFIARLFNQSKQADRSEEEIFNTLPLEVLDLLGLSRKFIEDNLEEILGLESKLDGLLN